MHSDAERESSFSVGFAQDVREGLLRQPKRLSCTWLYDETGSQLFERICTLPEYYLTRAEDELLTRHAAEIARRFGPSASLVELGSGNSLKTTRLIDAFLASSRRLRYLPIEISRTALLGACARLAIDRPALELSPILAEYQEGLRAARTLAEGRPKLIVWLGSSIGNFAPADAAAFLKSVREQMTLGDLLLVGIDLRKDGELLARAYDDSRGVTARFNLNLLTRINRELGGHFELERFRHRASYDESAGCVSMFLVSRSAQRVAIDALEIEAAFQPGERIHTESSYKYSPEEIDLLATNAGFSVEERWFDRHHHFSLNLLGPVHH